MEVDLSEVLDDSSPATESEQKEVAAEVDASSTEDPGSSNVEGGQSQQLQTEEKGAEEEAPNFDFESLSPREKFLLERLEKVTGETLAHTKTEERSQEEAETSVSAHKFTPHNYIGDADVDELLSTADGINTLLNAVYQKAMQDSSAAAAENVLRQLPVTISTYVRQHLALAELATNFYRNNPDLQPVKRTVAQVANEVAAEKPELTTEKVFEETATRVRRMLNIKKPTQQQQQKQPNKKPAFVSQRGRSKGNSEELQGIAREISELIEL